MLAASTLEKYKVQGGEIKTIKITVGINTQLHPGLSDLGVNVNDFDPETTKIKKAELRGIPLVGESHLMNLWCSTEYIYKKKKNAPLIMAISYEYAVAKDTPQGF